LLRQRRKEEGKKKDIDGVKKEDEEKVESKSFLNYGKENYN